MKNYTKTLFLLLALVTSLGVIQARRGTAQTLTTLHSFTALDPSGNNSDGANPGDRLILLGNTLYGTCFAGGGSGNGTVFALSTDGSGFMTLHSFNAGSDGVSPSASLILSNTLYGITFGRVANFPPPTAPPGFGTVFKVNIDGTGFTTVYDFTDGTDGAGPYGGLVLSGSTLYGTAIGGNPYPCGSPETCGTVFSVNANGTSFTTLYYFTGGADGAWPSGGLILSGSTLYGTASAAGSSFSTGNCSGNGTVFSINTNGTSFSVVHIFTDGLGSYGNITNIDGDQPKGLIVQGRTLYGTAEFGGDSANGVVYAVNADGTAFTTLHSFTALDPSGNNSDGANPANRLILLGNTLYGTCYAGGASGSGTVFALSTNGADFRTLYSFSVASGTNSSGIFNIYTNYDGMNPSGVLSSLGNSLYGTTDNGGSQGNGTVFRLTLGTVSPPQLTIIPAGTNVVLMWTNTASGFALQSTANLVSPVWNTNLPSPAIVNGQYTVTNPISGTQQFFRLSQ